VRGARGGREENDTGGGVHDQPNFYLKKGAIIEGKSRKWSHEKGDPGERKGRGIRKEEETGENPQPGD